MRSSQLRRLLLFIACMPWLACLAAPSTDVPTALETSDLNSAPVSVGTSGRAGDRSSDSRTTDTLMEMQQPKAGIQFNEGASRNTGREGIARAVPPVPVQPAQVEGLLNAPSGLFGSGATPAVQARTQNIVDRSSSSDAMPARTSGRPSSSDTPPELKRWLQWPREVIEYVRENRGFVLGCTALLLLLAWMGSMMVSRRRG